MYRKSLVKDKIYYLSLSIDKMALTPSNFIGFSNTVWFVGDWRIFRKWLERSLRGISDGLILLWMVGCLNVNLFNWINDRTCGELKFLIRSEAGFDVRRIVLYYDLCLMIFIFIFSAEGNLSDFALRKDHFECKTELAINLFAEDTR